MLEECHRRTLSGRTGGRSGALVLAVTSSHRDTPVMQRRSPSARGLTGEVRSVTAMQQQLTEAARLGFTRCIVPGAFDKAAAAGPRGHGADSRAGIREAIEMAL